MAAILTLAAGLALAVVPSPAGATPDAPIAPIATGRAAPAAFPTRPTKVLAIGDSVMEGAAGAIPAALPGRQVVVDTEVSRSTSASAAAAAGHGTDWDVVVVLLAHNDGGSPGAYQPAYRQLLDTFAAVPRVVVLTVHEVRPYYADVNAFLRLQAASRSNVHVADWNAVAAAAPGATAGDGLHLTSSGARLLADLVAGQVVTAEAEAAPPPTTAPPTTAAPPPPPPPPPPTTSTTVPPTTVAPTTTTTSTTTTTAPPPTTAPPARARLTRAAATEGPSDGDDAGEPAPPAVGVGLVAAAAGLTAGLRRYARTLPR